MPTKEESQKHLDDLKVVICKVSHCKELFPERNCEECRSYINFKAIQQLINEHFDNPPLKFEELKDNMVVWDNKEKEFIELHYYEAFNKWEYYWFGWEVQQNFEFEENRFYLKEVKENEKL